ncbi:MAG: LytR C-terminal domain-containing protein [Patescibacteria group bacterium]|jgi:hypothetical protein
MTDLLVFLSSNVLKITYLSKDGFGGFSSELPNSIVEGSEILDVSKFSESLRALLSQSLPSGVKKGTSLSFLINPEHVFLYFIPVSKNGSSVEDQIILSAKEKLPSEVSMDDLYFSYQKIAPFIYQFVAIRKDELGKFLAISNELGMPLKSVTPWVLLLPKLVNDNRPSIFIAKNPDGRQTVALSELGGIYFSHTYNEEKGQKDLVQLVQQLSLYNREAPISKIYTINYGDIFLGDSYEVLPLDVPGDTGDMDGYEIHLLHNKVVTENPLLLNTQMNLLNLLPVPVVQRSKLQIAPVVAVVGPMLVLLLVGGFFFFKQGKSEDAEPTEVLSETSQSTQTKEPVPVEEVVEAPKVELKKSDLRIRVENGTNVGGLAAKTQTFLEGLGYQISGIGDSEKDGLLITEISLKQSKKAYESLLDKDMTEGYTLKVDYDLDEARDYDVLITVGNSE